MKSSKVEIVPPWLLAVFAMFSVQLGSALSLPMMSQIGAGGTAWLRLSMGALIFIVLGWPALKKLGLKNISRNDWKVLAGLGITTGLLTVFFLSAIERIPLGTAVAIEFLGPLTVAAIKSHNKKALLWPALAFVGVVLLTQPWEGEVNVPGITYALLAAVGWGTYIILTQKIGDRFSGISGLALTIPIAALTAAVIGVPQAVGKMEPALLIAALGLAILLPVLPYALEMLALKHLTQNAFGTLMAMEPAMGLLLGIMVLDQIPNLTQWIGISLVVFAGASAQKGGRREKGVTHEFHSEPDVIG